MTNSPQLDIELAVFEFIHKARLHTDGDLAGIEGLAANISHTQQTRTSTAKEMSRYLLAAVRMAALLAQQIETSYTPRTSGSDLWTDLEHVIRERHQ